MRQKEYEFAVDFHLTYGTFYEEAKNIDEAYDKALKTIGNALKDLPVEVEFEVECVDEPDEDLIEIVLDAVDQALGKYSSDNVDVVHNEETEMLDVVYHSKNNSFTIESGIAYTDEIDLDELENELDKLNVGHCWQEGDD